MNKDELHRVLIGLKVFSSDGLSLMKKVVEDIQSKSEVIKSSSVYRISGEANCYQHVHDLRQIETFDGLAAVLLVSTTENPEKLLKGLKICEEKYRNEVLKRSVSLNLLVFDEVALMTPELTLPYPELHLRPENLLLAAEVWGEYTHPVLKESLYTLTRRFHHEKWGRFFAQGKTLLDF